jgi:hypothetical protein
MQIQGVFFIVRLSTAKQVASLVAVQSSVVHSAVTSSSCLMMKNILSVQTTSPYLQMFVLQME